MEFYVSFVRHQHLACCIFGGWHIGLSSIGFIVTFCCCPLCRCILKEECRIIFVKCELVTAYLWKALRYVIFIYVPFSSCYFALDKMPFLNFITYKCSSLCNVLALCIIFLSVKTVNQQLFKSSTAFPSQGYWMIKFFSNEKFCLV